MVRTAPPRLHVRVVPRWRAPRARCPWLGALGHGALLLLVGLGLAFGPLSPAPVAVGAVGPAPLAMLAERPQVALEPFGLWWSLMGSPTLVFADPTLDAEQQAAVDTESALEFEAPSAARGKLAVPWRTQLDGSRFAGANCGPASLAMILEAFGLQQSVHDLRYRSHSYQGTWGSSTGTALEHLARVSEDFGVPTRGLYDGRRFRSWSIAELREEVRQGHAVMILVKYHILPGHQGSGVGYDHYIVLWDLDGDDFVYNDPAFTRARDGYARRISPGTLERATRSAIIPGQAVAFLPPKR
jgi:hypothetical protein